MATKRIAFGCCLFVVLLGILSVVDLGARESGRRREAGRETDLGTFRAQFVKYDYDDDQVMLKIRMALNPVVDVTKDGEQIEITDIKERSMLLIATEQGDDGRRRVASIVVEREPDPLVDEKRDKSVAE